MKKDETFEMIFPMVQSELIEIRELSKKHPNDSLNPFKVRLINKKLKIVKELLSNEPSAKLLEELSDSDLPSNSDAVLIISEYINALKLFQSKYYTKDGSDFGLLDENYSWKIED